MNTFSHVPPGFRFHPTDEELVDYYLRKKVASAKIDLDVIRDVDLYRIEPWDIQEMCSLGTEEQNDWYFFSHKDKKYPTGTRTNRATKAGFWKATGRDKAIYARHCLVGMRKTLVFYQGRAPNGLKSDWIMHEYRLETNENATPQEEGWVVCRAFKKRMTTVQKMSDYVDSPCWYDDSLMSQLESPRRAMISSSHPYHTCKQEHRQDPFLQLPQLESPMVPHVEDQGQYQIMNNLLYCGNEQGVGQVITDWRVLDKLVASQLSHHQDDSKETNYVSGGSVADNIHSGEYAASASCQIDLWK